MSSASSTPGDVEKAVDIPTPPLQNASPAEESPEYPSNGKVAVIMAALLLAMFLVALVSPLRHPAGRLQRRARKGAGKIR
jgi:hypothetical protein